MTEQQAKDEIEKGFSAVKMGAGHRAGAVLPLPGELQHGPPEMVTYLGTRNIAMFSCDLDSFDFKARNAQQVIDVMTKLDKLGKGIILMHDFQKHTAEALPDAAAPAEGRRLQGRADEPRRRCRRCRI
jgi:hypothetical protein